MEAAPDLPRLHKDVRALGNHRPMKMKNEEEEACRRCFGWAGQPTARGEEAGGLGIFEDFLEEEDSPRLQRGGRALQEIHELETSDLN